MLYTKMSVTPRTAETRLSKKKQLQGKKNPQCQVTVTKSVSYIVNVEILVSLSLLKSLI